LRVFAAAFAIVFGTPFCAAAVLAAALAAGKLAAEHTPGGHRRYDLAKLRAELFRAAEAASAIP
jgi:hypothetical protein